MDKILVDEEFIKHYNFLMLCNNILVSILKYADANNHKWKSTKIDVKDRDLKKWQSGDYSVEYFRTHGYALQINKGHYRNFIFSVLSDYVSYVYDAILCAAKMHPNQAYTLLRKPLKDNLLLLELAFTRKNRFISQFLNKDIGNFSIDKIDVEEKRKIIERASKKIKSLVSARIMFDFRYSKKSEMGLERIWSQTSHIITTCKDYKTANGSLNMIFNDDDNIREYVNYFFIIMPYIQYYVMRLTFCFLKEEELISELEFLQNDALLIINLNNIIAFPKDIYYDLIKNFSLLCPHCNNMIGLFKNKDIQDEISKAFYYKCPKCNKNINLDNFLFYNVDLKNKN